MDHTAGDYETLVRHAPICIHEIDLEGLVLSMNPAGLAMLELPLSEVQGRPYLDFVAAHDRDRVAALLDDARQHGEPSNFDFTSAVGGKTRHFASGFVPVRDADGRVERLMGLTQDVSSRISALRSVRESEARFRDLAETAAEFFWELDADLSLLWATGELGERWMRTPSSDKDQVDFWREVRTGEGAAQVRRAIRDQRPFRNMDVVHRSADGTSRTVALSGKPLLAPDGSLLGWRGSGWDVTTPRALAAQLSYHASHDELTGLLNRREFSHRLERLVQPDSGMWPTNRHVLCFMDLDQFKVVNDTSGHVAGDEMLRQLADLLRSHVRETDLFARLGGDEFAIVMHGTGVEDAKRLLHTILETLADWRFEWGDRVFSIGASVGVVGIGPDSGSVDQILAAADTACYAAKDQGRNRCVVFNSADSDIARRRDEIDSVSRITQALDCGDFRLFAQPIVPIDNPGTTRHVEVLVRMLSPGGERLLSPGEFLPAAEQFGLANRLDLWVVEHALSALDRANGIDMCAINLSGVSLGHPGFLDHTSALLDASSIDPARICFEITETAAITNVGHADRFISTLRARGCKFSLDDFGSGLASFAYLKNLDVDFLKIDGSFIRNILTDPVDRALVRSIIDIGKQMGKTIIAEWVESAEVHAVVTELGVDMAQGYHLGRPEALENFLD